MDTDSIFDQWLKLEYQHVAQTLNDLFKLQGNVLTIGTAIFAVWLLYAFQQAATKVHALILLPIGLLGLLLFYMQLVKKICLLSGYRKWLEERANDAAGKPVLMWECSISPLMESGAPDKFGWLDFMYMVFIGLSIWLAVYSAATEWSRSLKFRFFVGISVLTYVTLGYGVYEYWGSMGAAAGKAYKAAQAKFKQAGTAGVTP